MIASRGSYTGVVQENDQIALLPPHPISDDVSPLLATDSSAISLDDFKPHEPGSYLFRGYKPLGIQYTLQGNKVILEYISYDGSIHKWNKSQSENDKIKIKDEIVAFYNKMNQRVDLRTLDDKENENQDIPVEMKNKRTSSKHVLLAELLYSSNNELVTLEFKRLQPQGRIRPAGQFPKETHRDLGSKIIYSVRLERPLGIRIDTKQLPGRDPVVVVSSVSPNGAAAAWNKSVKNPAERIQTGDRIMAFHEIGGSRIDVSQRPGREIADHIYSLQGDSVIIEFERSIYQCCNCIIM